ncbi:MAG: LPP20 family lipoprotein [Elusimicrobia bacterium]|nr:LPP20 family lipoprotein [Elusimicrobiota bacterium]
MNLSRLGLGVLFLAAGCAGGRPAAGAAGGSRPAPVYSAPPSKAKAGPEPDWVMKGGGAFPGETGTVIYGVGITKAMDDRDIQRKTSAERARQEVAATLKTTVATLTKDYMKEHIDLFRPQSSESVDVVERVAQTVTEATLLNCRIVERWVDPTGALYSLARLDLDSKVYDTYKASVGEVLRSSSDAVVKERAAEAFKDLDAEVGRQQAREKEILKLK